MHETAQRELGQQANRRLRDVHKASQDCLRGEAVFRQITSAPQVGKQRASALPYGDEQVLALLQLLRLFRLVPCGFRNRELREQGAPWLGIAPSACTQGQMTYHLRRLRVHGLIERQVGTHRYHVTERGLRVRLFVTRSYARLIRPALGAVMPVPLPQDTRLPQALAQVDRAIDRHVATAKL